MYNKLNTRQEEFLEKKMVDDKLGKPDEDGDLPSLVQDICTLRFEQKMNVDVQKGADVSLLKVALVEKDIDRERGDVLPPVNTSIPVKNMTDILKEFQEKSSTEQDRTIEKLESLKAAKDYDGMQKFVIGDSTIGGSTNTRLTDHSYPVNILQIILHGEDPPKEEIGLKNTQPTFKTTATSLGKFLDTCVCVRAKGDWKVRGATKATWYTGLKLILFIDTPGTFCAREQKGLLFSS